MTNVALQVRTKSLEKWGVKQAVDLVGVSSKMRDTLDKVQKFAKFNQTILITGESGVGKELLPIIRVCLIQRTAVLSFSMK